MTGKARRTWLSTVTEEGLTALIPEEIARAESRLDDGVMAAVGNTPTVSLNRLIPEAGFSLYGKLEGLNPGGSAKDRAARNILTRALRERRLRPGGVVIESSSGNFAIGLAQTCAAFGLRPICVLDARATA